MENPFKYNIEISGRDFVDRERELAELRRELLSRKSVIIYSLRRLGKSLLLPLIDQLTDVTLAHQVEYEHIWDNLHDRILRKLFPLMARQPVANYSHGIHHRTRARVSRTRSKSQVSKEERNHRRGRIADMFFAEWLRR
jgi:hypothetical protein